MKIINGILEKLNINQKESVTDESLITLVNANVGSGKTTVLIAKVFYQHFIKGVDLKDMVVLTFTNKAADEIKRRIKEADAHILDEDMPYFGTFHSVALKMLKTILPVHNLGYITGFTVMDPDELLEMALELIAEKGLKIKYKNKLKKRFEELKAGRTSSAIMKYDDDIEILWKAVSQEKMKQNKMDFDDLIIYATKLLEIGTFSPKWIIIDEFQDCDEKQLELINALKVEESKIFAVGDPNQIIYTWRGSKRNIFREFKKEYDAKEYTLPVNYRSSTSILDAAKCFLSEGTMLCGTREAGKPIVLTNHYDPFNEANYLMDKIKELHNNGVCYSDIAVFYRMQKQSQVLEEVFQRSEIPFEVSVKKTLADIPVLRWFVNLLKASINENDTGNLVSVLRDKTFGEGLTKSKIRKIVDDKFNQSSGLCNKVRGFKRWIIDHNHIDQTSLDNIYSYFDLENRLSPTSASYGQNKEYLLTLLDNILKYTAYKGCSMTEGIKEFVNSSTLYGVDILKENKNLSVDSVKLMTLHACKGLEFKYVFIIGANSGLIPLHTVSEEEQVEEKRLFFVGITRAIDELEISYYTSPGNPRVMPGRSSYLNLIPRNIIESSDSLVSKSNLNTFRREIKSKIENRDQNQLADKKIEETIEETNETRENIVLKETKEIKIKVRHKRYGIGTVELEDDNKLTVLFEGYGIKEFAKGFNSLEFL